MNKSSFETVDWYDSPLYYDMVFDEDTHVEGDFLEQALARYGRSTGREILEPACGSGRLLEEMASRGYSVTGFDLNPKMLEFAGQRLRRRSLVGTLKTARLEDFRFRKKFDLAHCLVSTFKYLLDEKSARAHLECVRDSLKPGGLYVLGFHLSDYETTSRARERWVAKRAGTQVTCNIQSWPPDRRSRQEKVRSRLVVEKNGATRRFETYWQFRTYDAAQARRLFRSVPELEHLATYDFCYDFDAPRPFDDDQQDCVVVFRRES